MEKYPWYTLGPLLESHIHGVLGCSFLGRSTYVSQFWALYKSLHLLHFIHPQSHICKHSISQVFKYSSSTLQEFKQIFHWRSRINKFNLLKDFTLDILYSFQHSRSLFIYSRSFVAYSTFILSRYTFIYIHFVRNISSTFIHEGFFSLWSPFLGSLKLSQGCI